MSTFFDDCIEEMVEAHRFVVDASDCGSEAAIADGLASIKNSFLELCENLFYEEDDIVGAWHEKESMPAFSEDNDFMDEIGYLIRGWVGSGRSLGMDALLLSLGRFHLYIVRLCNSHSICYTSLV